MEMTEKTTGSGAARWGFYLMGLLILAMGLTLNTKAGLGVSPIISLSYAASVIWNRNFGDMTFVLYGIFVLIQAAIHLREKGKAGRSLLMKDAAAVSIEYCIYKISECIFSVHTVVRRMRIGGVWTFRTPGSADACPDFYRHRRGDVPVNAAGANPGDGLVQVLADTFGIGTGLMKNCVDAFCIVLSLIMGLLFAGKSGGNGIGTVCAVMLVGRVIALFHHIFGKASCRRLDWKVAGTDRECGKRVCER